MRWAKPSTTGQFLYHDVWPAPYRCGLCDESHSTQRAKARHLRVVHRADIRLRVLPNGVEVYEWATP
jgi:hypothetical protein